MPYPIEIISVGGDFDAQIKEVFTALNSGQNEFQFVLPPENLKDSCKSFLREEYHTKQIWAELSNERRC